MRWLGGIAFVLFVTSRVAAGGGDVPRDMLFSHWTTRDGLPNNRVHVIRGTRDGFLWIGTDGGLARFDGSEFVTFELRDGLGALGVQNLHESAAGDLWVGTMGGGLNVVRNGEVVAGYGEKEGLPAGLIRALGEDSDGRIWASDRWGNRRWSGKLFEAPADGPADPGTHVLAMHLAADHAFWASCAGSGLWRLAGGTWQRETAEAPRWVNAFTCDPSGRLWASDADGRLWNRNAQGRWQCQPPAANRPARINALTAGADGTIWALQAGGGVFGFADGAWFRPTTRGDAFLNLANAIWASPDGLLWVGTTTQGLYALRPSRIEVLPADGQPPIGYVLSLVESSPGVIIAGTQNDGVHRLEKGHSRRLDIDAVIGSAPIVNRIVRLADGVVAMATTNGVVELVGEQARRGLGGHRTPPLIWDICDDGSGKGLFACGGSGDLYQIGAAGVKTLDFPDPTVPLRGLWVEKDGGLWVGSWGKGLFHRSPGDGGAWRRYGRDDGLPGLVLRVLLGEDDGTLWAGTAGGGLAVIRGGRIHSLDRRHGLPDDTVSQLLFDDTGRLWVGTHRGLAVIEPGDLAALREGTLERIEPMLIDSSDGLPGDELSSGSPARMADGRLAFPTTRGVAVLDPADFTPGNGAVPVRLTAIRMDGREVPVSMEEIRVYPGTRRLEIHGAAVHFVTPGRVRFRSRLIGLEDGWSAPSAERVAVYRGLAPGQYRFEIAASIGGGQWGTPAVQSFLIEPHFWQTAWFRAGIIGLCLAAAVAITRIRERRNSQRALRVLERRRAVEAERGRIARDLHDDVGAGLTQVALLSELAGSQARVDPSQAELKMKEVFATAKKLTRALDEIVWAANPANDSLESFSLFLGAFVQNFCRAAGLRCRFDYPEVLPEAPLDSALRHHLYLACKEVVHNAVKHADASQIRLAISLTGSSLEIVIEDDGRGIDSNKFSPRSAGGDGMPNLESRLREIGGAVETGPTAGGGTRVVMKVPWPGIPTEPRNNAR